MIVITGYKIAVCLGYLRLLGVAMPVMQKVVKSVLIFVIFSHIADTLVIVLQCLPVAKSWNPSIPGHCLANYPTWNATAAITILCDITIFLLPVFLFAKLQIDIRRKISLIVVFVLGIFTTLCSIMRMLQIQQVAKDGNNSSLVLWGTAEMNVGVSEKCIRFPQGERDADCRLRRSFSAASQPYARSSRPGPIRLETTRRAKSRPTELAAVVSSD